jgi:hypothetical protein
LLIQTPSSKANVMRPESSAGSMVGPDGIAAAGVDDAAGDPAGDAAGVAASIGRDGATSAPLGPV